MHELGQRTGISVRLLGRSTQRNTWRKALISEGFAVPAMGPCSLALADLSGHDDLDGALLEAVQLAGVEPLIAVIGMSDQLPSAIVPGVVLVRTIGNDLSNVSRAIRKAALDRQFAAAASVRYRALSGLGLPYRTEQVVDENTPVTLLSEPSPHVLPILKEARPHDLVAPLTSSSTLRMLENGYAGALLIHIGQSREHRLPVLKLVRRQSDLSGLPVAVMRSRWDDEAAQQWLKNGVDLVAVPHETERVMTFLNGAARSFRTQRMVSASLANASVSDRGEPSPLFGPSVFARICAEHHALGDPMAYGVIELTPEDHGTDDDLAEAGIYMTMALSPIELVTRVNDRMFLVAMPYADRFYARRLMRTLRTLVEDLKFGEEPTPVLITTRHVSLATQKDTPIDAFARLREQLGREQTSQAIA